MERPTSAPAPEGLAIEAIEWLPSGSDSGLVRVRGRWSDAGRREPELPALFVRRGEEARRFESLPDARFGREATAWRATYLVPAALMEPLPDELSLSWDGGARAALPMPTRGFEPPQALPPASVEPVEQPGGEVIDRAVMAERRARRAEAAERASAARAAEALKAVEVLELRSAELERRLEALRAAAPAAGKSPSDGLAAALAAEQSPGAGVADASAPEESPAAAGHPATPLARISDQLPDAAAAAPLADLPAIGPRAEELTAAVAAVTRLRGELLEQRRRLRKSELLRAADAVALASLREQEGRMRLLERQYAASRAELARARAAAEANAAEAREQVALAQERAAADAASVRAQAADELAAIADELTRVRAALASVRRHAVERAAVLERRLGELETTLAAERRAHAAAATELETTRAGFAAAETANHSEAIARAALEEELDRERLARAALAAALAAERSNVAQARSGLAAAEARIAELERAPESHVDGLAEAGRSRIAPPERAPVRHAGGTVEAGSGGLLGPIGAPPYGADRREREFAANLDAAAAALRAHSPLEPAAAPVSVARGARSRREYPWLRAALVRLAREDPRTAARLIVALVPAQGALVTTPLEYDVTIRGAGTYAISIGAGRATARGVREPRPRGRAAFHVAADVATLAEVLAGVDKRMGRWIGSVKVHGRRRGAEVLRDALVGAQLDLAAAARAGAELDPDLVWRALAHAIDPAWTKGHTFTIVQEITGPRPLRWHVRVRDGAPVAIERHAPAQAPDAVVAMSRAAFSQLLRGEPAHDHGRPTIRGDRSAVAMLKAWTDRAQGHAG